MFCFWILKRLVFECFSKYCIVLPTFKAIVRTPPFLKGGWTFSKIERRGGTDERPQGKRGIQCFVTFLYGFLSSSMTLYTSIYKKIELYRQRGKLGCLCNRMGKNTYINSFFAEGVYRVYQKELPTKYGNAKEFNYHKYCCVKYQNTKLFEVL